MKHGGLASLGVLVALAGFVPAVANERVDRATPSTATPPAECGPGSRPETGMQGRVSAEDHFSGYSDLPITCNTELIGHFGESGGFKVERYVDAAGHECAYVDSTLVFPIDVLATVGTWVFDMADPANPVLATTLVTPAMVTPHESLLVNQERGLLGAVMGNPAVHPGVIDLYDISADCRQPQLISSSPAGILGHESGWTLDGLTFYAASLATGNTTAVDVSNPLLPVTVWTGRFASHGLSLNDDGTRAYLAARTGAGENGNAAGLIILDTTEIQQRVLNPQVSVVSTLTWPNVSIPQNALPITIDGHPYLLEIDEFAGGPIPSTSPDAPVGAARIIDIGDEAHPAVISEIRLEVHEPENRVEVLDDPGTDFVTGGYSGHYCGVPREVDPRVAACSFIGSGLRIFDIRDPFNPREIAYFNSAGLPETGQQNVSAMAFSRPTVVPERGEVWYSDGVSGFYVVRVTNGVWPFAAEAGGPAAPAPGPAPAGSSGTAATGSAVPFGAAVVLLVLGLAVRRTRGRA